MSELSKTGISAMVHINSRVPEWAMTAEILGTERSGHGIRIRPDGLIATVGYLVLEAEQIWIRSHQGQATPGYIVAQDYDSGITLLKPTLPLEGKHLTPAPSEKLSEDEPLYVYRSGHEEVFTCRLFAIQEFAGRWEYLAGLCPVYLARLQRLGRCGISKPARTALRSGIITDGASPGDRRGTAG